MQIHHPSYLVAGPSGDVEIDYTIRDETLPVLGLSPHPRPQHWHDVRKAALERDGWRCVNCNGETDLQGHHRTYQRWGRERVEDVYILCDRCHEAFHKTRRLAA